MKKLSVKTKKILKTVYTVIDIVLCLILVSGAVYAAYLYIGYNHAATEAEGYEPVSVNSEKKRRTDNADDTYFWTNDSFSVLVVSDLKLYGGRLSADIDKKTLDALYGLITEKNADVVVINGAVPQTTFTESGWIDNLSGIRHLLGFMKKLRTCWAVSPTSYTADFYNRCLDNTPESIYKEYSNVIFSNIYQTKEFNGIENASILLSNTKGEIRMTMAVLDFSPSENAEDYKAVQEQWLSDWAEYNVTNIDRKPYKEIPQGSEKYVVSPCEIAVPADTTLILPQNAAEGEFFAYSEITIEPAQKKQK